MRLEDFVKTRPDFEFPTHFCLAGAMGHTSVCFQNFYDQIFRDTDVPVDLHLFGFDGTGSQVGELVMKIGTGEAVQVPCGNLGMQEPGLIAVSALPRFDLHRLAQGKLRVKRRVGTGFYLIWQDAKGHVDTMHEWLGATLGPRARESFYAVFDHADGRIARYGLVLMSPVLDRLAQATPQLSVYTRKNRTLMSSFVPPLLGMASRIVYLDEVFPTFASVLANEGALGVRVQSTNLVEPFTVELQRSGDFHIHHIN
jgi:hypothetical protein